MFSLSDTLGGVLDPAFPLMSNLANASAVLNLLGDLNWCGFYLAEGSDLYVGPFQGETACVKIPFGKGVCGTAAMRRESVVVPDVNAFPGHIACSSRSRSEIVVPILRGDRVLGVIDLDSPTLDRFKEEERKLLEAVAEQIAPLFP